MADVGRQKGVRTQSDSINKAAEIRRRSSVTRRQKKGFFPFRGKKQFFLTFVILCVLLFSMAIIAVAGTRDGENILNGVAVADLGVGNLSQDEATVLVENHAKTLLNQPIKVKVNQQILEINLLDLGLSLDTDLAVQEAYDVGRAGSALDNFIAKLFNKKNVNIPFAQSWDEEKLGNTLRATLGKFDNPAKDATFQITDENRMAITGEQKGSVINYEALAAEIMGLSSYVALPEIEAEYKEQQAQITAAQLEEQKITGRLSSYTTKFNPGETARSENVRLATRALDMAVIKPGETLSFNQIVGERTVDGGYKDAYIILNGEFVPGLAGGICQVSSTLYNTGLLANLAVSQRSNHDLSITYVPLGQDATVAYPSLDLKFVNNTGGYLLIRTAANYDSITIDMYGKVKANQEVFIANTINSILPFTEQRVADAALAPGSSQVRQSGQQGYVVSSTRTVKVNGEVVSTEPLSQSRYSPLPRIVADGPAAVTPPPEKPNEITSPDTPTAGSETTSDSGGASTN